MSLAVFLKSLFTGQEPWDTFCIISGQLLVAAIPARPRDPERGGEVCVREEREQRAQRSAAAFLASRPSPAREVGLGAEC